MGYCISQINGKFFMEAKNKPAALEAMFEMWNPRNNDKMHGGSWGPNGTVKYYSWMNLSADDWRNRNIKTLEEGLEAWEFDVDTDDQGNIISLWFDGEKAGDEDFMIEAIAPYVEAGSYLDFRGEDDAHWRWEFDGKTVTNQVGRVSFD